MAAKLTITSTFTWTDGKDTLTAKGQQIIVPVGQTAAEAIQQIVHSSGTWQTVNLGGVTPQYLYFENKDTAQKLTIATDNAGAHVVVNLAPGEAYPVSNASSAYYANTDAGNANLLVQVVPA